MHTVCIPVPPLLSALVFFLLLVGRCITMASLSSALQHFSTSTADSACALRISIFHKKEFLYLQLIFYSFLLHMDFLWVHFASLALYAALGWPGKDLTGPSVPPRLPTCAAASQEAAGESREGHLCVPTSRSAIAAPHTLLRPVEKVPQQNKNIFRIRKYVLYSRYRIQFVCRMLLLPIIKILKVFFRRMSTADYFLSLRNSELLLE